MSQTMNQIQIMKTGSPDVMEYKTAPLPEIKPAHVLVKLDAVGVNFIDIYHRKGVYELPLPIIPGLEGAGTVAEMDPAITEFEIGDRVCFTGVRGAYSDYILVPAEKLVKIPHGVGTQTAAALMLQGMTAHYLTHSTYPLKNGDRVLIHAAAGGVGLFLIQMAKKIGAKVFGSVSTKNKAKIAREAGCDEVILYTEKDFEEEIKKLTNNQGVHVVYDSVGKSTFNKSLNVLTLRGYMVLFGQSSGPVPSIDPQVLNRKGSLFLTRPSLFHYVNTREELLQRANDVLGWTASGELQVHIGGTYALKDAAKAHQQLESRQTTGKLLLIP